MNSVGLIHTRQSGTSIPQFAFRGGRGARTSPQFDRKLDAILKQAAAVFCAKGFDRASIRDIARQTRVSLAGLYYYFSSKDELLFLIQRHAFKTMLAASSAALQSIDDPEERLRIFIRLHLQFFLDHPNEMKVLAHEVGPLAADLRRELRALKKTYYQLCFDQVAALQREHKLGAMNTRLAVLALFGMMNWIYQWYNPRVDPDAETFAEQMTSIFLYGILGRWARRAAGNARARKGRAAIAHKPGNRSWQALNGWGHLAVE